MPRIRRRLSLEPVQAGTASCNFTSSVTSFAHLATTDTDRRLDQVVSDISAMMVS